MIFHDLEDHSNDETSVATILLSQEINLCYGDYFVIRDQSASITLGGGRILNPCPPGNKKRESAERETLNLFKFKDIESDILTYIQGLRASVTIKKLVAVFNLSEKNLFHLFENNNLTIIKQSEVISEPNLQDLEQRIEAFIRGGNKKNLAREAFPSRT